MGGIRWKMLMERVCMAMLQGNHIEKTKVREEIYNRVAHGCLLRTESRYSNHGSLGVRFS
jgi:hypothetical protein